MKKTRRKEAYHERARDVAPERARAEEQALVRAHVDLARAGELGEEAAREPGVVHEEVEVPVAGAHGVGDGLHGLAVGHVALEGDEVPAALHRRTGGRGWSAE